MEDATRKEMLAMCLASHERVMKMFVEGIVSNSSNRDSLGEALTKNEEAIASSSFLRATGPSSPAKEKKPSTPPLAPRDAASYENIVASLFEITGEEDDVIHVSHCNKFMKEARDAVGASFSSKKAFQTLENLGVRVREKGLSIKYHGDTKRTCGKALCGIKFLPSVEGRPSIAPKEASSQKSAPSKPRSTPSLQSEESYDDEIYNEESDPEDEDCISEPLPPPPPPSSEEKKLFLEAEKEKKKRLVEKEMEKELLEAKEERERSKKRNNYPLFDEVLSNRKQTLERGIDQIELKNYKGTGTELKNAKLAIEIDALMRADEELGYDEAKDRVVEDPAYIEFDNWLDREMFFVKQKLQIQRDERDEEFEYIMNDINLIPGQNCPHLGFDHLWTREQKQLWEERIHSLEYGRVMDRQLEMIGRANDEILAGIDAREKQRAEDEKEEVRKRLAQEMKEKKREASSKLKRAKEAKKNESFRASLLGMTQAEPSL
jgi:hypothetical protein